MQLKLYKKDGSNEPSFALYSVFIAVLIWFGDERKGAVHLYFNYSHNSKHFPFSASFIQASPYKLKKMKMKIRVVKLIYYLIIFIIGFGLVLLFGFGYVG